ncbi:MAG: hypothetical protein L0387_43785, partial [Acidobacteria bacterium]|nr:hypothetical protein [Acidobacteriota bacterium]
TYVPFFKTNHGFSTTLFVRNAHLRTPATVTPVLMADGGRQVPLPSFVLAPNDLQALSLETLLANAGTWADSGAIRLAFTGAGPNAVGGHVMVKDADRSLIFAFPFRAGYASGESRTLNAPWWLLDKKDKGTLALANASTEPITVHPSVTVQGRRHPLADIWIGPRRAEQFDLRQLVLAGGIDKPEIGSLTLRYEGEANALHPALFFMNEKLGYSATSPFSASGAAAEPNHEHRQAQAELYGPSVLVNAPDPSMGFPEKLAFVPYGILSNTTDAPLSVAMEATYELPGQAPQTVALPVGELAPLETRWLDFSLYVAAGLIPPNVGQINLRLSYPGPASKLLARVFSMDQSRDFVFSTELTHASPRNDVAYWDVAGNEHSMVLIQNVTDAPVEVRVTLEYHSGQGKYKLPVFSVPARATRGVNLRKVLAEAQPDEDGNMIPAGVTFGAARIARADGRTIASLAILGTMYDPVAGMCGEFPLPCIGVIRFFGVDDPTFGIVGTSGAVSGLAEWNDGSISDESWQSAFDSSAPSIVSAGFGGGLDFIAPGEANITVSVELPEAIFRWECLLAVFTVVVLARSGGDPTVTFGPLTAVGVNHTADVQVTINPPAPVTLTLGPTSGMGSAVFTANNCNCASLTISSSQMVTIKGVTVSSTANNMRLSNNRMPTNFRDFTVLSVTLTFRNGPNETVSSDNQAAAGYFARIGTLALGTRFSTGSLLPNFWGTGVEIRALVTPSNYAGLIILRRHLDAECRYNNMTLLGGTCGNRDDPSGLRDEDPQSGGSQGKVYDLDFPRIQTVSGAPIGVIGRFRFNFRQWAEVDGVRVSAFLPWFSRVSIIKTSSGDQLATDVPNDNTSGTGTTPLTWNLQPPPQSDPPPPPPDPGPDPGPIIQGTTGNSGSSP